MKTAVASDGPDRRPVWRWLTESRATDAPAAWTTPAETSTTTSGFSGAINLRAYRTSEQP